MLAQPGPVCPEPLALPGDDRPWLDDDESVPPAGPGVGKPRPEQAIRRLEAQPSRTARVDGELVPEREDFELQRAPGLEEGHDAGTHCHEDCSHGGTLRGPVAALNAVRVSRGQRLRSCCNLPVFGSSGPTRHT